MSPQWDSNPFLAPGGVSGFCVLPGQTWFGVHGGLSGLWAFVGNVWAKRIGRTYAAVDNFIRAQMKRPDDPYGVKRRLE